LKKRLHLPIDVAENLSRLAFVASKPNTNTDIREHLISFELDDNLPISSSAKYQLSKLGTIDLFIDQGVIQSRHAILNALLYSLDIRIQVNVPVTRKNIVLGLLDEFQRILLAVSCTSDTLIETNRAKDSRLK
jgi:hypothetical protein